MSLVEQIEEKRREIHTDAYPMSIGELINLYADKELDIHPEFQRIYRWSEVQKSRLIESILLGIPLPSFFVAQREDGIWDVVDGLQRLSTIFSFLGIYKNEAGETEPPLVLKGTEYLPALEGMAWSEETSPDQYFSVDLQRAFKREKVDLKIIKKESDDQTKYELFQRLNTFGSSLSDQEVRNCLLIMIDRSFYEWIKTLADYEPFLQTLTITSRQFDEQYHLELALRFLILKDAGLPDLKGIPDIGDYITKSIKAIASDQDYNREEAAQKFKKTFDVLAAALEDNAFRKFQNGKYTGGFSLSIYEVMALGLGNNVENYDPANQQHLQKVREVSQGLLEEQRYIAKRGAGYKASDRLPQLLPLGIELLKL